LEDAVVGEEACLGEARDGRAMSTAASGDDSAPEAKGGPVDRDGARTREAPLAQEDIHAEAAEPCRRIVETDAGADGAHALHHGPKATPPGPGTVKPKGRGHAQPPPYGGETNHPLRRHAAHVEETAPEQIALEEGNAGPQPGRARRRHQAGCASADN